MTHEQEVQQTKTAQEFNKKAWMYQNPTKIRLIQLRK